VQRGTRRPFQRARLRYDATFALEAGYAFDHGIPFSEYLQRWLPEDRAKVSAVTLERSERCTLCGTAQWEWEADPNAYTPIYHTCHGCRIKDAMAEDNTPKGKGTTIRLAPRKVAERMIREAARSHVPRRRKRGRR
jgi:hypothetical protein